MSTRRTCGYAVAGMLAGVVAISGCGSASSSGTTSAGAGGGTASSSPSAGSQSSPSSGPSSSPSSSVAATPSSTASPTSTACATSWGTGAKTLGTAMSPGELVRVRAGRHDCFDRLVFDVSGSAPVGASARYVSVVLSDAAGKPVRVAGSRALQVVVRAPVLGTRSGGHQPPAVGARLVSTGGLAVVRDVRFAGSFEGVTTVAVGVDGTRAIRLLDVRDQHGRHVVVDVAHR